MKYICDGEKYNLSGQAADAICLPMLVHNLPQELKIEGNVLIPRSDFHVTLVAVGQLIRRHSISIPDFLNKVIADFCEFIQKNPVDFVHYRNEFRFVTRNKRRSVVVLCDISNLNKFFDLLNQKYNLQLEYPPTHVTLFTLQPNTGIFLIDSDDIQNLTTLISNPMPEVRL